MKDAIFVENLIIKFKGGILVIDSSVMNNLKINLNHEVGGVLYGFKLQSSDEYIISGNTEKQDRDFSDKHFFYRKDNKHFEIIKKLWEKDKVTMYFGDWHYHPVNYVYPSTEDYKSFKENCITAKTNTKFMFNIISSNKEIKIFIYDKKNKRKIGEHKILF